MIHWGGGVGGEGGCRQSALPLFAYDSPAQRNLLQCFVIILCALLQSKIAQHEQPCLYDKVAKDLNSETLC